MNKERIREGSFEWKIDTPYIVDFYILMYGLYLYKLIQLIQVIYIDVWIIFIEIDTPYIVDLHIYVWIIPIKIGTPYI